MDERCSVINEDVQTTECLGEYNNFYLFNPFGASVMEHFLENLCIKRKGRGTTRIIYVNPVEMNIINQYGFICVKKYYIPFLNHKYPDIVIFEKIL